jgi:hypothetical protein
MKLLLNGCSFMDNYYYKEYFTQGLGAETVNLAKAGSSNRRIIRTTVDYIERNQIDFVIIGLTFYDRQEIPILYDPKPVEGNWVSYNSQGFQGTFIDVTDQLKDSTYRMADEYVKSRYKFDINEYYIDQLYLDLRMLSGYLSSKGIKFCIFNTCDKHFKEDNLGPGFVPFNFIGNEYLENNGSVCLESDKNLPKNARHHYEKDVIILVNYLIDFIKNGTGRV